MPDGCNSDCKRAEAVRMCPCSKRPRTDMFGHERNASHQSPDHRRRPRRLHRRDLRRARQPVADPGGRHAARRPAHHHHRRRKLPRIRRRHPGPLADGADGGAGHPCRHAHRARHHHRGGFLAAPFRCQGDSGDTYTADAVIIATGAQARWLGLESEQTLQGRGVSACATCDGFFYRGKTVAVVGGGNTAVEEALYLTHHADKVTLIHRRDSAARREDPAGAAVRAPEDRRRLEQHGEGDRRRRHAGGRDRRPPAQRQAPAWRPILPVDGVFIAIGHTPTTAVFAGHVDMDAEGYIRTMPGSTRTSVPGVFAAGDVQDKVFRQAVTAAGTGCMAALEAEKFLAEARNSRGAGRGVNEICPKPANSVT